MSDVMRGMDQNGDKLLTRQEYAGQNSPKEQVLSNTMVQGVCCGGEVNWVFLAVESRRQGLFQEQRARV